MGLLYNGILLKEKINLWNFESTDFESSEIPKNYED